MAKISMEHAEKLISWPEDSKGYAMEKRAIQSLIKMCDEIGYGRVQQLVEQICKMYDGKDVSSFIKWMKGHRKELKDWRDKNPLSRKSF